MKLMIKQKKMKWNPNISLSDGIKSVYMDYINQENSMKVIILNTILNGFLTREIGNLLVRIEFSKDVGN